MRAAAQAEPLPGLFEIPAAPMETLIPTGPWKLVDGCVCAPKGFRAQGPACLPACSPAAWPALRCSPAPQGARPHPGRAPRSRRPLTCCICLQPAGMYAGLRAAGTKGDLALIVCDTDATVAGVFTLNVMCAAPVTYCKERLAAKGTTRAVLVSAADSPPRGAAPAVAGCLAANHWLQGTGYKALAVADYSTAGGGVPPPQAVRMDRLGRRPGERRRASLTGAAPRPCRLLVPAATSTNRRATPARPPGRSGQRGAGQCRHRRGRLPGQPRVGGGRGRRSGRAGRGRPA